MRKVRPSLEHVAPVAGLYGNRIDAIVYYRGRLPSGTPARCIRCPDVDEPPGDPDELISPDEAMKSIETILVRYAASGQFTPAELRTLNAIWLEHDSLRSIAEREGVSAQAVRARIEGKPTNGGRHGGILKKAPEFALDWPLIKRAQRRW